MSDTFLLNPKVYKRIYEQYSETIGYINWQRENYEWRKESPIQPLTKLQLEKLLKIAFWASLKQEEGRFHNFSLCLVQKEDCLQPFEFDEPILLDDSHLAKLAPAFDSSANFIGIWHGANKNLYMWGFASITERRMVELFCEVISPGQILVSFKEVGIEHFSIFITGSETKFVKRSEFLTWVIPGYEHSREYRLTHKLSSVMIAVDYRVITTAMRSHQHGGTLLVVQKGSTWSESIRKPITNIGQGYSKIKIDIYSRNKLFDEHKKKDLGEKIRLSLRDPERDATVETVNKSLKVVGNLTAVDGATVINSEFDILAFGVKIEAKSKPESVLVSTPFEDEEEKNIKLSDLGGTRHQSAVQFVYEQKDAMAFVVSQDGRISVMKWSPEKDKVCVIRPAEFALL